MYLAVHEGNVVGGHVNFYYKEDVTAWYGMASERGDQFNAGTLLYATAMREACAEGYRSYNLGASLGKASLIEFKRSLGGVSYEYRTVRHRSLAGRVVAALRRRGGER
jgi:lipid II:glycine glycyltransferase (peptidoglycan interpeptide bridge formation enzyme)